MQNPSTPNSEHTKPIVIIRPPLEDVDRDDISRVVEFNWGECFHVDDPTFIVEADARDAFREQRMYLARSGAKIIGMLLYSIDQHPLLTSPVNKYVVLSILAVDHPNRELEVVHLLLHQWLLDNHQNPTIIRAHNPSVIHTAISHGFTPLMHERLLIPWLMDHPYNTVPTVDGTKPYVTFPPAINAQKTIVLVKPESPYGPFAGEY